MAERRFVFRKGKNWNETWYANASPTTDGERVYVSFGSAGMYCYDFEGKGSVESDRFGQMGTRIRQRLLPVLYDDLVILWCGPNKDKGRNYLLAVDKKTGKTKWIAMKPMAHGVHRSS